MAPTPARRGGSLDSGLEILEVLSEQRHGLGVTDIAARLGMDKGNAHRLLQVLQDNGYVSQDPGSRAYRTTSRVLALAGSVLRNLDLRAVAEPVCEELLEVTGESVHASQLTSAGVVYVLQRRAPFRISVDTEVGARPPLYCTATGKAVLAYLSVEHARTLLPEEPYEGHTFRTHVTADSLWRDLTDVRARGFAMDDEEYNPGVRCVAAPIFGLEGTVVGCLGMSGPVQRVGVDRLALLSELVVQAARDVTNRLGGLGVGSPRAAGSAAPDAGDPRPGSAPSESGSATPLRAAPGLRKNA